jgi:ATP phosphoribosyltransferase regulatory subunit HisZ
VNTAMQALHARASRLSAVADLSADTRAFWRGYAKAIEDLANGTGDRLAAKDALAGSAGAGAGLPVHVDGLASDAQGDGAQGVELTRDNRTSLDGARLQQLEHPIVALVDIPNEEHSVSGVDVQDDATAHRASVATGGEQ